MNSPCQYSQTPNKMGLSTPDLTPSKLIVFVVFWLTLITSNCLKYVNRVKYNVGISKTLEFLFETSSKKKQLTNAGIETQSKFGVLVYKLASNFLKNFLTLVASMGGLCSAGGFILIHTLFTKCRNLLGLIFLVALFLFNPSGSMQSHAADPRVTLVGAGPNDSLSMSSKISTAFERNAVFYYAMSVPYGTTLDFTINFSVTERQHDDFLADKNENRSLNLAALQSWQMSTNDRDNPTIQYIQGFVRFNDDNTDEIDGVITFTLKSGTGYTISETADDNIATINVTDDDSSDKKPKISLLGVGITADTMESSYMRTLTISEAETPNQNTTVYFLLNTPVTANTNFTINYELTERSSDNFIVGDETERTLDLANLSSPDVLEESGNIKYIRGSFSIANDDMDEANGEITLTLQGGSAYVNAGAAVTVNVTDDDVPLVSISENNGIVSESTPSITYTLSATPTPYRDITIKLMITDDGDFIAGDPDPDIVMTKADNGTKPVTVILQDDRDDEADDSIIIQVIAGDGSDPGYEPVADPSQTTDPKNTITINVSDDDVPSISIIGDASVSEDDNAIFRITADINPRVDLTINVEVTQSPIVPNQLLYSDADQMGNHSTTVSMATTDNQETQLSLTLNDMGGGFITVTITTHDDGNYELNTTNDAHIHTIQVIDPDTAPTGPVIELVPVTTATITEGTDAVFNFQVATGGTVTAALELDLSITQTGSFFDESLIVKTVTIATSGMGEKTIPTLDDDTDEANGSIIVSILQGRLEPDKKNYRISEDTAKFTQSITVQDNDIPQVSITGPSGSISESDDSFNYILTAIPRPYQPITIILDISQTGDVFATTPSASIELTQIGTKTETITLDDDTTLELDSKITIRVASGTGYDPVLTSIPNADPSNTISFIVTDDDFPQVSISESNGTVNESGGIISYTLSATPTPLQDVSIELSIVETGDVIAGIPVTTIEMKSSDAGSKTGIIVLVDDTIDEVNSTITIQVLNGTGYVPVSNPSETTDPQHTITINVADDDIPQISITGGTSVSEEDDFVFTLQADITPRKEITISIGLSDEPFNAGDQLYAQNTARTVKMKPSDYRMTTYTVRPNEFNIGKDRRGGFVTVTVNPSSDNEYAPADFGNSHTIRIIDQNPDSIPDGPVVLIAPDSEDRMSDTTITEGVPALIYFQVATDTRLSDIVNGLTVDLRITQTGNFFDESQITKTVGIATDGRGEKTISTVDDDIDEADGIITVEIVPGHGDIATKNYRISDDPARVSHTIMVADNDTPQVSISESNGTVSEGDGIITYMLTATPHPYQEIFITVDIMDQSGNGILGSPLKTIPMSVSGTAIGLINLNDNNIDEMDNTITIQVKSSAGDTPSYEPVGDSVEDSGPEHTIEITVADNDVPQISITGSRAVSEDNDAVFTLTADILPKEIINIGVAISQSPYNDDGEDLYDDADGFGNHFESVEMDTTDMGSKELSIELDEMGSGGTITVTVDTSMDGKYVPAPTNSGGSFTTLIIDENSPPTGPVVELVPVTTTTITEGDQLEFTIQAIIPAGGTVLTNRLEVNLGISQVGNYLDGVQPNTVTIPTRGTASISIATEDDNINEPDGSYTVEILRGSLNPSNKNYRLSNEPAKVSQTIMVQDNDIPQVSISRIAAVVSERDQTISYIITATPAPNQDITIAVNITETGAVISGIPNTMITMSTTGIASGEIILTDDEEDEYDSIITVQVLSGTGYQPVSESTPNAEPSNTITILVKDDEELDLKIAIHERGTGPIEAGRTAEFVLTSTEDLPDGGLNVDIHVSQEGSFIMWRLPRSVHMVSSPQTLSIETVKRPGQDEVGGISVMVLPGLNSYGVDERSPSAGFRITNANPITTPDDEARISVASLAVNAILTSFETPQSSPPLNTNTESPSPITRPLVSIVAVEKQVDEGAPASFVISTSNRDVTSNITVSFQVQKVRVEIELPNRTSVPLSGKDQVVIAIPTINNDYAEREDGFVTITLSEDPSYLIAENGAEAIVNVSDAIDRQNRLSEITAHAQAFIPDLTGTMGANSIATISNRIKLGFSESGNQKLEFGGQNSVSGMLTASGDAINESSTSLKSFLDDSSFAISLESGEEFVIPTTLWGQGDYQNLSSLENNGLINWSGDLFTGHIGIDAQIQEGLLTGISASVSESEVEFENNNTNAVQFDSRTTALNPYLGWTSRDQNTELYATFGLGRGELEIKEESYHNEILDSESYSIGLSGNQLLYTSDQAFTGTTRLSVTGESWFAHRFITGRDGVLADFQTNNQHVHISAEGSHHFEFVTGSTLSPHVTFGLRSDAKDHHSFLGLELSSGADYNNPIGISFTSIGSMLVNQTSQVQKMELESSLIYDLGNDKRGILLEVAPKWSTADTDIQDVLWKSNPQDSNFDHHQYSNGISINSELGYGFSIFQGDGLITPISGFDVSTNQAHEYHIGTRLVLGPNTNFELSGVQRKNNIGNKSTAVRLDARMIW